MRRFSLFDKRHHKLAVLFLLFFALIFYFYAFLSSGIEKISNVEYACVTLEEWFYLVNVMAFIDTFLTMIFPFFLIFTINLMIICKLMKIKPCTRICNSLKRTRSNRIKYRRNNNRLPIEPIRPHLTLLHPDGALPMRKQQKLKLRISNEAQVRRSKAYSRTTRMLIILSSTFLILHSPIAFNKIWYFVKNLTLNKDINIQSPIDLNQNNISFNLTISHLNGDNRHIDEYSIRNDSSSSLHHKSTNMEASSSEEIIERLSCYVYYLNFSLNFFLYTLNSSKFKKILFN